MLHCLVSGVPLDGIEPVDNPLEVCRLLEPALLQKRRELPPLDNQLTGGAIVLPTLLSIAPLPIIFRTLVLLLLLEGRPKCCLSMDSCWIFRAVSASNC
jgi:hypothetical protein